MSFKICTIGSGWIAESGHGPAYKKYAGLNPDTVLAACCDIDPQKAAAFQEKFGFKKYYTDYHVMLMEEKPDAVCLVVPVNLTSCMAIDIMEMGYPLIMEKPPGINVEQTLEIIRTAEKYNIPNQVAFNRRHVPFVKDLKNLLNDFKPEEIQNLKCDFYRVGRNDNDFSTTAIHGIDTVKYLAQSQYKHVRFEYSKIAGQNPNVVNIFMDCIFENGITAQLTFCPMVGVEMERIVLNVINHSFLVNIPMGKGVDSTGALLHFKEGNLVSEISGENYSKEREMFYLSGFYHENESFFDDIKAGRMPSDNVQSSLQSVQIAECIRNRNKEFVL